MEANIFETGPDAIRDAIDEQVSWMFEDADEIGSSDVSACVRAVFSETELNLLQVCVTVCTLYRQTNDETTYVTLGFAFRGLYLGGAADTIFLGFDFSCANNLTRAWRTLSGFARRVWPRLRQGNPPRGGV